jgi:AP2 domain-containing protein/HNH endonuclease
MNLRKQATQPRKRSYRRIKLTRSQFAKVDASDYEWLNQWNWYALFNKLIGSFYAVRGRHEPGQPALISMHRAILGDPKGLDVDHINHDTLDNRRKNLRKATRSQNLLNARRKINNSGFKGVYRHPGGKWKAQIQVNHKYVYLGYFSSPEEAHKAYVKAAKKLAGIFACGG